MAISAPIIGALGRGNGHEEIEFRYAACSCHRGNIIVGPDVNGMKKVEGKLPSTKEISRQSFLYVIALYLQVLIEKKNSPIPATIISTFLLATERNLTGETKDERIVEVADVTGDGNIKFIVFENGNVKICEMGEISWDHFFAVVLWHLYEGAPDEFKIITSDDRFNARVVLNKVLGIKD